MSRLFYTLLSLLFIQTIHAEDGYELWLRYNKIQDPVMLQQYRKAVGCISFPSQGSPTLKVAHDELLRGLGGLLDKKIAKGNPSQTNCFVVCRNQASCSALPSIDHDRLGREGFALTTVRSGTQSKIILNANSDIGILYGIFHFLRLLQTNQSIEKLSLVSVPKIQNRILNHWDNLNRHVERGYAGISIWNWHQLPDYIDKRYIDYARANASVGINGTVLTNVNANALVLTKEYLVKVKALADIFRPYGIRVYLTARFSAPIEMGGLKTADPLNDSVRQWWKTKVDEIYAVVPDFGGFLVKANSEGQPGPQSYGRTHADGANLLADALAPHNGLVMWRAFVYSNETPEDRVKQAYNEFKPLDGRFRKNVLLQVKNGPLDFQPREPFSPLFGAMPQTPLMMEFQLTQEYLGQGTHLAYEAPMFKETMAADTYAKGRGSTVAKVIDGTATGYSITGIAGVANIGNERNWTNHPFGQANWYAFGRLAWNHELTSEQVADEWIRQTFQNDAKLVGTIKRMMLASHEAVVNYMTPLGLVHIMGTGHHYGPAPWVNNAGRADWNPVYYHRADAVGIGFNRTSSGSNAISQYAPQVQEQWKDSTFCDEKYLLWFHHVSWSHKMKSGRQLWDELCTKYQQGVDTVRWMQRQWTTLENRVDGGRFQQVNMFLQIQEKEAVWWRNACLLYFQTFSKKPFPANVEKPDQTLEYYQQLTFPFAPGNG